MVLAGQGEEEGEEFLRILPPPVVRIIPWAVRKTICDLRQAGVSRSNAINNKEWFMRLGYE
jgi:hypothetical protein